MSNPMQLTQPNLLNVEPLVVLMPLDLKDASKDKGLSKTDNIFLAIALMMAEQGKTDEATKLSPSELEDAYIEQALASGLKAAEEGALTTGDESSLDDLKKLLTTLLATLKGADPTLTTYLNELLDDINNFKGDPAIQAQINKIEKERKDFDADYNDFQKAKEAAKKDWWNPDKEAADLAMMAYYALAMKLKAGTTNWDKAQAKFNADEAPWKKAEAVQITAFVNELSNDTTKYINQEKAKIDYYLASQKSSLNSIKGQLGVIKALGSCEAQS